LNAAEGPIINIPPVIGSKGGFGQTNYAAAKAGMHGFTKSLALEVLSGSVGEGAPQSGWPDLN
jgi:acetoacetyl-CoA reductase